MKPKRIIVYSAITGIFAAILLLSIYNVKKALVQIIDEKTVSDILYFANKINTEAPKTILSVNTCDQQLTDDELLQILLNHYVNKTEKEILKINPDTIRRTAPCKGQTISISNYTSVTQMNFPSNTNVKIIGRSMHDSTESTDFALMKLGDSVYAYTHGHICGSINFEYTRDSITANDLVTKFQFGASWHMIRIYSKISLNQRFWRYLAESYIKIQDVSIKNSKSSTNKAF